MEAKMLRDDARQGKATDPAALSRPARMHQADPTAGQIGQCREVGLGGSARSTLTWQGSHKNTTQSQETLRYLPRLCQTDLLPVLFLIYALEFREPII
jgi:hypothetical protein